MSATGATSITRLIVFAGAALGETLPRDLRARIEERVVVQGASDTRSVYPDASVVERPGVAEAGVDPLAAAGEGFADPLLIAIEDEPTTEGFLRIVEAGSGGRVVTVLEVLSPSNKLPGPGQDQYRRTQRELIEGGVSLVEVDLVRAGERVLVIPQFKIPPSHRTAYQVCVSRASRRGYVELYRAPLRARLPVIRVPLRETDADVPLDLQSLIDRCYREGVYDDIDYRMDPDPPLPPDDRQWADELLRNADRR